MTEHNTPHTYSMKAFSVTVQLPHIVKVLYNDSTTHRTLTQCKHSASQYNCLTLLRSYTMTDPNTPHTYSMQAFSVTALLASSPAHSRAEVFAVRDIGEDVALLSREKQRRGGQNREHWGNIH